MRGTCGTCPVSAQQTLQLCLVLHLVSPLTLPSTPNLHLPRFKLLLSLVSFTTALWELAQTSLVLGMMQSRCLQLPKPGCLQAKTLSFSKDKLTEFFVGIFLEKDSFLA